MSRAKIEFDNLPWQAVAPGLRLKQQVHGGKLLRLLEFTSDYDDQAWCEKGHSGYVLEGCVTFVYDDGPVTDPTGPTTGPLKVVRGGSFGSAEDDIRPWARTSYPGTGTMAKMATGRGRP